MKTAHLKSALTLLLVLSMSSCLKNKDIITDPITDGFDYKTTKEYKVTINALTNDNLPFGGVQIKLFTQNPLNEDGTLKADNENYLIYKGSTNSGGELSCQIAPPTSADSLRILVNQIGLPSLLSVVLNNTDINVLIGGATAKAIKANRIGATNNVELPTPILNNGFYMLGANSSIGVPNYLFMPSDTIVSALLKDINTSLPESKPLTSSHPQYLEDTNDGSVKLYKDAEVWITFVHEGAGYTNTLGYYTHPNGNPPSDASKITDKTVIFPNVSFTGSGGGLSSGNKVQLLYLNPVTKLYTNIFPAGTTVAWVFLAQGWSSANKNIQTSGVNIFYSDARFNPEVNTTLKKHNVVLNDSERKLLLIGFEDLRREGGDQDFNDAVFYVKTNPYTAIEQTQYKSMDKPMDADGDGITDANDEYPNDAKRAYNNYYPAKNSYGTLAFEDLWPSKGDYDFNDLVIEYNYNQITNGQNQIVAVNTKLSVKAIGASKKNGFGIQFNTEPSNILSVTGQILTEGYVQNASNGVENVQSKAVVIAFENAWKLLGMRNTVIGEDYYIPRVINLNVEFVSPINASDFGSAPYNPFIIIDGNRTVEVHLPNNPPTDLINRDLLGTNFDNSFPNLNKYYVSDNNLPWAINVPISFNYPIEKASIVDAFLYFNSWASSKGTKNTDWYVDKVGYRNVPLIYVHAPLAPPDSKN